MELKNEPPNGSHIVIPTSIFYVLLTAALFGGAGSYSVLAPNRGGEETTECRDTSKAALELGVQQARHIADIQDKLSQGTRDRFTQTDAERHIRGQTSRDDLQDRRIDLIEKLVDGEH